MFDNSNFDTIVLDISVALVGIISLILFINIILYRKKLKEKMPEIISSILYTNLKVQNKGNNGKIMLYRNTSFLRMKNDGNNPCEYDSNIKIDTSLFYDNNISMYF